MEPCDHTFPLTRSNSSSLCRLIALWQLNACGDTAPANVNNRATNRRPSAFFFPPPCFWSHFTQCRCNICCLGIAETAEYSCRLGFIRQINSEFQTARAITEPCTLSELSSNCQFNLPSLAVSTVLLQSFVLVPARWDTSALVFPHTPLHLLFRSCSSFATNSFRES